MAVELLADSPVVQYLRMPTRPGDVASGAAASP